MLLHVYSNRFYRNHTGKVVPRVFHSCWKLLAFDQIQLDAYCTAVWRRFEATFKLRSEIPIYILKWVGPWRDLYFLGFIYLFCFYIHVCFQLDDFIREREWHKALVMEYSMRHELTCVCSFIVFNWLCFFLWRLLLFFLEYAYFTP